MSDQTPVAPVSEEQRAVLRLRGAKIMQEIARAAQLRYQMTAAEKATEKGSTPARSPGESSGG